MKAVSQKGDNPVVFNQTAKSDNLQVLMAAASERNPELTVRYIDNWRHEYIDNFGTGKNDYMKWTIRLTDGADYHVWALAGSAVPVPLKLSVEGTEHLLDFSTRSAGVFEKQDIGIIHIPSGTSTLKLAKRDLAHGAAMIKSLELVRESDRPAYEARIAEFRNETASIMDWFRNSKYGLMFQFGSWAYPRTGPRKNIEDATNSFDVQRLMDMVMASGASYVLWSLTWFQFRMQAPIKSLDRIMGHGDFTSERDLVGEIARACQNNGIKFILYYYHGVGEEETWRDKQNWPSSFGQDSTGDRSTFFDNFCDIMTEVGNRYGTSLDGWFIDDGNTFYPAPFERIGMAMKSGNPDRIISINPGGERLCRLTEFQNVFFGEYDMGLPAYGSAQAGGDGVFMDGPQKGLLQHGMFPITLCPDNYSPMGPEQPINVVFDSCHVIPWVEDAISRRVPLSINIGMWEDQTVSLESLKVLEAVKNAANGMS